MANGNDGTSKVLKEVFQNRQGGDIKSLVGSSRRSTLGFQSRVLRERGASSPHRRVFQSRFRAWNVGREIAPRDQQSKSFNGRLYFLSNFLEEINHALALIQPINLLREISHPHGFPDNDLPRLRLSRSAIRLSRVDLPTPLSPTIPMRSLFCTKRLKSCKIGLFSKQNSHL